MAPSGTAFINKELGLQVFINRLNFKSWIFLLFKAKALFSVSILKSTLDDTHYLDASLRDRNSPRFPAEKKTVRSVTGIEHQNPLLENP
jgi:hypothetical protein